MNIIITGASKGLGRAIAEKFAAEGHHLYLCSRNETALYHTVEALQTKHPHLTIRAKAHDLSIAAEAVAFGKWILDLGISIDALINNAGSFLPGNIYDEEEGTLEKMLAVNLFSAYHLTRALLPSMIRQNPSRGSRGHIFNMCSIAGLQAYPNGGSYSISKFALSGFSKNLRDEMKPFGIKVTGVYPGAVFTDSWAGSGVEPERIMEPEDVATMIYAAAVLSPQATVEDIVIRPQKGDL